MPITKYSDSGISTRTNLYAAGMMLESADPVRVLDILADVKPMPRNKTQRIKFRRPVTLDPVLTPLVEGQTPETTPFRFEDVEGSLKQYGQITALTDEIQDTHEDPVLKEMTAQVGKNAGRTWERLMWGVLRAGTNVFYANGTSRSQVNTTMSLSKQRGICMALETQYAEPVTKMLSGSVRIGTRPVEGGYVAFCHSYCMNDIRNMEGFTPRVEYGSMASINAREFGAVEDVRYVRSPDLPPFFDAGGAKGTMRSQGGSNADVHQILYVGQHAYGTVPLRGQGSIEPSIVPVSKRDKNDPLGQVGYVGWKGWFLCLILNQLWMARLEAAVTDLG